VQVAKLKAGDRLRGASVASDAFFPFRDGLDAIAAKLNNRPRRSLGYDTPAARPAALLR